MSPPPLARLAERFGILSHYVDQSGKERRDTSDETRVALLRCLGVEAGSTGACLDALATLDARERRSPLAPVQVVEESAAGIAVRHSELWEGMRYQLSLSLEGAAQTLTLEGRIDGARRALPLPAQLPTGYHRLSLELGDERFEQTIIAAPATCVRPAERLGGQRGIGITTQLYALTSARNQGIGDLTDLATLAQWAGEHGASFVGVNPLHALRNRGGDVSPYSPLSRLFKNPIYLDVTAIPELAASEEARALWSSPERQRELARVRAAEHVDYAAVRALKWPVLAALHRTFQESAIHGEAGREYRAFVEEQGAPLVDFATFSALDDAAAAAGGAASWRQWAPELRQPDSAAVLAFRKTHATEIDFHCYLQFQIDRQLAAAAAVGKRAGLTLGLYQDLAIGSAPDGSDTWAFQKLFVDGAAIGAPPDGYSKDGQNWGLPPLHPLALAADGYRFFIRVVRAALRHAGALRIDHALGLFRQFWIPDGKSGKEGAYVNFPAGDLLGILALESRRHDAVIVGEDLGTVPPEVPPALHARGILSSRVLYFERDEKGRFTSAAQYERDSLTTANTHDMPTLEGYWRGQDLAIKRDVGLIDSAGELRRLRAERQRERRELFRRLTAEGVISGDLENVTGSELRVAVHAFLERTPASLVGFSLEDLVGEIEPVNVPGVDGARFESWTRKLHVQLEELSNVTAKDFDS